MSSPCPALTLLWGPAARVPRAPLPLQRDLPHHSGAPAAPQAPQTLHNQSAGSKGGGQCSNSGLSSAAMQSGARRLDSAWTHRRRLTRETEGGGRPLGGGTCLSAYNIPAGGEPCSHPRQAQAGAGHFNCRLWNTPSRAAPRHAQCLHG